MKTMRISIVILVLVLAALAAAPSWGKMKPLTYPPLNPFEISQPDKIVLDNGLRIYLLEDHSLPLINVSVSLNRCGSYLEPPGKIGLASMAFEVMRTGGTTSRTGDQIDEELESIGASVETFGGIVNSGAGANGLSEYSEKIIGILADVLRHPVFNQDKIELAKTSERTSIAARNDQPMNLAIREFQKLIYGAESPYARNTEYATVDAVTRDDMVMFHQMLVQPNNMQIGVVGDFKKDEMLALLKKYFGDWPKGTIEIPPPPTVANEVHPSVNHAEKSDITQSNILIGHVGGTMGDPDYPATIVMNGVLGGSFGSRLTNNVRVRRGLAYTARGEYVFQYSYPGWFYAYAATKLGSTAAAIKEMITQIRSMQTIPATPEEMKLAKDGWLNSFVFNFESKGDILGRMMTYDYYGFPLDYLQQLKTAVEKVTPQDVLDVSKRKLNPDNLQILVVGKADEFDEPLSTFGEVKTIDITIPAPAQEAFTATDAELILGKEMLLKAAEACGGVANFKKVKSVAATIKMTMNTPQGSMTLDVTSLDVLPDKMRQDVVTPMGTQTVVVSGGEGWVMAGGQTQMLPASQLKEQADEIDRNTFILFAKADNPDCKVACKGEGDFQGKKAVRLEFLTAAGKQFTMYLDPVANLPIGMKYMEQTMAGPGESVSSLADYKDFSGLKLPTKISRASGGMTFDVEVVKTTINGPFDASLFAKPEGK